MNLASKLQEKVVEYCKKLSHKELQDLVIYLGNGIDDNVKPTKVQQDFCEKFLGAVSYANYLKQQNKEGYQYFGDIKKTSSELAELFRFVAWQSNLRISNLLLEISKLETQVAKKELETEKVKLALEIALFESYEDGEFSKIEGWCNISDVLVKHKLLKLDEQSKNNRFQLG